jgi:glycosyltransferase involved in cell wall biosynthesis
MQPKRIAFIKKGKFSHINNSLIAALGREFADHQIDVINAPDLLSGRRGPFGRLGFSLINRVCAVKEFGRYLLPGGKRLSDCLRRTGFYFGSLRKAIQAQLAPERFRFTFQTQSLFDASIPGTPHFVYTDHASLATMQYPGVRPSDIWPRSWIELEQTIYANAKLIFTMSGNISKCLIHAYGCDPSKVACVYAGANLRPPRGRQNNRDKMHLKNVLFVGIDWARKGGPCLARAWPAVLRAHADARLTVVGCSPDLDLPHCEVVGKVPLERVHKYFEKATVFCLPTRLEPFGIVFLEAFSYKLPVIATNIGAIPEFVLEGENGFLAEPEDHQNLANRLIELLDDPVKCRKFGDTGFRLVSEKYNWEMTAARIKEHIERAINGRADFG